jgi:antirestriction protein
MNDRLPPTSPASDPTDTEPRAWVGCLACLISGRIIGHWVPAVEAADLAPEVVHGRPTSHDELWCFDVEGLPIVREMSPTEATEWGRLLDAVEEWQRDALIAWVRSGDYVAEGSGDLPSLSDFEERYVGEWDSFKDYAIELFEECGYAAEIPEHLLGYFDLDAWARDLAYDYTTERSSDGAVHVFRSL